uniref:PAT1 homolog 1, processing body mRNA decay factor n=1 Tax=Oryzias latipes TaxID=8090 RepID=A0A3P9MPK8_ORYLA
FFLLQSLDDDCTLEEEDDGLVEEEDEIDQFNDDTFGAGAIDADERAGGGELAESVARLILEADPAIAGVGARLKRLICSPPQDSPLMSIIKEVGLPKRPLQGRTEEGWDLSERVPPPRSSSPVIGSPPVRAVPIGTPPKQPMSHALNHQIHHPTAVHVRAPLQHRYPPPFPERLSPNTLLNIAVSAPHPARLSVCSREGQRGGAQTPSSCDKGGFHFNVLFIFRLQVFIVVVPALPCCRAAVSDRFLGALLLHTATEWARPRPYPPSGTTPPTCTRSTAACSLSGCRAAGGESPSPAPACDCGRLTAHLCVWGPHRDRGRTAGDRRPRDPYSNLMSQKEKEWVTKIQMMQLQSTDPYLDDYYYQNYYEKMEKRQEKEQDSSSRKEHATKLITPQVAKVEHTYRPVQFAGSLGKLTVSSVNNPRKMIDAVVTSRSDDEVPVRLCSDSAPPRLQMFSLLLEVQDFEKRFVQTPEEERPALLEQHKTNTEQLSAALRDKDWEHRVSDDLCVMIMSVRKGKRLMGRLLPFLPAPQAAAVVMAIARNLPILAKKDKQDQFGVTLLYLILSEGERMQSSDPVCQTELVFSVMRELLSVSSSSLSPPLFTPPNLLSLFSRYVDRQRLELLQDKLQ